MALTGPWTSPAGPVGSQLLWDTLILVPGKDDHVHAPEDAHDPAHHNDGREHLNEGRSDIQPEDAAHVPVREVGACPTQHSECRDECTYPTPATWVPDGGPSIRPRWGAS